MTMLAQPAELRHQLKSNLPRDRSGNRPHIFVRPQDEDGRQCAAWCADHFEVRVFYTATAPDSLAALEQALKEQRGAFATTRVVHGRLSNPEFPRLMGRRYGPELRPQVWALIR